MKKTAEKANELKADFLKRVKIDKYLARLIKKRRGLKSIKLAMKKSQ